MKIIARDEARAKGLKRYYTFEPCHRGHIAERLVSNCCCLVCFNENSKARRAGNPESVRQKDRERYAADPEKALARGRRWKNANRELLRERQNKRRTTPGEYRERYLAGRAKWRDANREKIRADQEARRRESPERLRKNARRSYWKNVEKSRERVKAYREKNLEREKKARAARKYWREWRAGNLEHAREYARRYYAEKPNKAIAIHKRRARKKQSEGTHTPADLRALLAAQSHRCAYCRADLRKVKKHLDHVLPLALGGTNDKGNLQWLCESCNLSKGAKHPVTFAQELGFLL